MGESMKHFALAALAALSLASCAKQYVAPSAGPTATLTLSASIAGAGPVLLVQNFDNEQCAPSANGTRLATFTTTSVQGAGDPHDGVARVVPAGRPMVFSYIYQFGLPPFTNSNSCQVTQSFVPVPGAKYRAYFDIVGQVCRVQVLREDGSAPGAVEALRRVQPACYNTLNG